MVIETEIEDASSQLKESKSLRKDILDAIQTFMLDTDYEQIKLPNGGSICLRESNSKKPMNKEYLEHRLSEYNAKTGRMESIGDIVDFIYEGRDSGEKKARCVIVKPKKAPRGESEARKRRNTGTKRMMEEMEDAMAIVDKFEADTEDTSPATHSSTKQSRSHDAYEEHAESPIQKTIELDRNGPTARIDEDEISKEES